MIVSFFLLFIIEISVIIAISGSDFFLFSDSSYIITCVETPDYYREVHQGINR